MQPTDHTLETIQQLMLTVFALPDQEYAEKYGAVLADLKRKYVDPEFRLAVIGNFSSGKSTFMNAVLQRNLLTVDTQPTTAIPTYIRWNKSELVQHLTQLRKEQRKKRSLWQKILDFIRELFHKLPPIDPNPEEPLIRVCGVNDREYFLHGDDLARFESDMDISIPGEINKVVDYLTTTTAPAEKIRRIELFFPEREGFQNLCLIDTPGVNPGDDAVQNHIVQTQSVLRKEADAAIVLYPAKDAMSKNLERFLTENAAHLMGDAIVLLTKMDIVPTERERCKIISRTKQLVAQRYNQEEPVVYGISAYEALECSCFHSEDPASEDWFRGFHNTLTSVFDSLRERRSQIANRRINHLLVELMGSIDTEITTRTEQLKQERQGIQDCSMEKLREAYSGLLREYRDHMQHLSTQMHREAEAIVHSCLRDRTGKMEELLNAATGSVDLNRRLISEIPLQMADVNQELKDRIHNSVLIRYVQLNESFAAKVVSCLKQHKRFFADLSIPDCVCPDSAFTPANSVFPYKEKSSAGWQTAVTVLLIVVTLGIYLIGMLVQWFVDLFTLDKEKKAALDAMTEKITGYSQTLIGEMNKVLHTLETKNLEWAEKLLTEYQVANQAQFEETERTFRTRENRLTAQIQQYQICMNQLTTLRRNGS